MADRQRPHKTRARSTALAATGLVASAAAGSVGAFAAGPAGAATPSKIYACYNTKTDALSYLNYPHVAKCAKGTTEISWTAAGSKGAQGARGAQGSAGNPGSQGPIGVQGAQGSQGSAGPTGSIGNAGSQGSQGTQGVQGATGGGGSSGPQGLQGVQGSQGSQGVTGFQGVQGSQGTQGVQGTQGFQGTQGTQGSQGTQGVQGTQGFQGLQGFQGTQGTQGFQGTVGALNAPGYYYYKTYTGTSGTVINYAPTVVATLNPGTSAEFLVNATTTLKDLSTGSTQFSCWLRNLSISRGGSTPVGSTPGQYVTAYTGHPATVAMTGVLNVSRSSDVQLVCELHVHGSGVRVTNYDVVMTKVSSRTANTANVKPRNSFVGRPGSRRGTGKTEK